MPLLVAMTIGDYIQGIAQGTIRAMGIQKYATIICIFGYWAISFPLTYLFAFVLDFGIKGIWGGFPIALFFVSAAFLYLIYSADFDEISKKISIRIHQESNGKYNN